MGYDRGDSFPFDFEPNGIPFGLNSKGNLSPPSYPIHCERKWKYSFLSARQNFGVALQFKLTESRKLNLASNLKDLNLDKLVWGNKVEE